MPPVNFTVLGPVQAAARSAIDQFLSVQRQPPAVAQMPTAQRGRPLAQPQPEPGGAQRVRNPVQPQPEPGGVQRARPAVE
jgi:hypothetical protein